ncbi:hypothetical protein ACFLV5_02420 [Chloroflexota bacterium]
MTETAENRAELLTLLNKAVARELQVSIQYMLQHTLLTGGKEAKTDAEPSQSKQGKFIGSHSPLWFPGTSLKKIAVIEMRHAEAVAERIVALEEKPTTQPDPVVIAVSNGSQIQICFINGMKIRIRNKKDDVITVNYLGILRENTGDILDMEEEDYILKSIGRMVRNCTHQIIVS